MLFKEKIIETLLSLTDIRAITHCTQIEAKNLATRLVQQVLLVALSEGIFELAPVMQKRFGHAVVAETQQVTQQVK